MHNLAERGFDQRTCWSMVDVVRAMNNVHYRSYGSNLGHASQKRSLKNHHATFQRNSNNISVILHKSRVQAHAHTHNEAQRNLVQGLNHAYVKHLRI